MSLCEFIADVLNTNSKTYALVTIFANLGTVAALGFTIHSVNESRNQNKRTSAKNSLDIIFKNIDDSLNGLTFFFITASATEMHFGRDVIYRITANARISGMTSNPNNYEVLKRYVNYLYTTLELINEYCKELENENLKRFYFDKIDVEIIFLTTVLSRTLELAKEVEARAANRANYVKTIDEINEKISLIHSWSK